MTFAMDYSRDSRSPALFQLSDENFDVLETRMLKRVKDAGISDGTIAVYRDGLIIGTYGVGEHYGTKGRLGKTNYELFDRELRA